VVGLKPTYGVVSLDGVIPLSSTMDHVGPIGDSVRTVAAVFEAISGRRLRPAITPDFIAVRGVRIGVPEEFFFERVQPEVEHSVRQAIERLASLGANIQTIRVPEAAAANDAGRTILLVEALEYHKRYRDRRREYGEAVRVLLERGEQVAKSDLRNAKKLRTQFTKDLNRLWKSVDLLVTPTTPVTAPIIGQAKVGDEDVRACLTRFVRVFNITGLPALSLPVGKDAKNLPIGLQIAGPRNGESLVLRAGLALETFR
jgi:aspartyl-tRNA(Asn)/glutamyl-tRNA(Gln) amidotransferase subunit A